LEYLNDEMQKVLFDEYMYDKRNCEAFSTDLCLILSELPISGYGKLTRVSEKYSNVGIKNESK